MNTYPYRTYAEIDLNKMQHNLRQVRAAIGPDCKLLFVLKADAYGHGTPVCAKYSEELVDWYAVATIDEALSIRRAGVEKPILLFGALQDPEIELAADNRITINSCSLEYSRHVAEVLQRCGKRMDCHIKIDTGMNRTGLFARVGRTDGAVRQAEEIFALEPLHVTGIYTHFPARTVRTRRTWPLRRHSMKPLRRWQKRCRKRAMTWGCGTARARARFVPPGVEARYDPRWNAGLWAEHGRGVGSQNGSQAHHALVREGRIRA